MIPKNLVSLYNWEFKDSPKEASIVFEFPDNFNPASIEYTLNKTNDSVLVTMQQSVPILCGYLYEKAVKISHKLEQNKFTILIEKEKKGEWPMMVKSIHSDIKAIDPKSAFICFQVLSASENEESGKWAFQMLQNSARHGYMDAIYVYSSIMFDTKGKEESALNCLLLGTEVYDDPLCHFQIGILFVTKKNDPESALFHLKKAADNGIMIANFSIGQIYSPISTVKYNKKDPKMALDYFIKIPENERSPGLLSELAEYYEKGIGVKQNKALAQKYREEAEIRLQEVSGIPNTNRTEQPVNKLVEEEAKENETNKKNTTLIVAATAAIASAIGFIVYRKLKSKK